MKENQPVILSLNATDGKKNATREVAIIWTPLLLSDNHTDPIWLNEGDRLLVKTAESLADVRLRVGKSGESTFAYERNLKANQSVPILFSKAGEYKIVGAEQTDGATLGSVDVRVIRMQPALIPCEYNFTAAFPLAIAQKNLLGCIGEKTDFCQVEPMDADSLFIQRNEKGSLVVNPLKDEGEYRYLIRLPDGRGTAIGKVTPFDLRYKSRRFVDMLTPLDDGTQLVYSTIYMEPFIPGVDLNMRAIISGLTLANSRTQMSVTTAEINLNGDSAGEYYLHILRNKSVANKFCHTRQAQYYGINISFCE